MARSASSKSRVPNTETFLTSLAERLTKAESLRDGLIHIHTTPDNVDYCLRCADSMVDLVQGAPEDEPLIELIGDPKNLQALLDRKKNPLALFAVGGFRIRGNPTYISALAIELGILDQPI